MRLLSVVMFLAFASSAAAAEPSAAPDKKPAEATKPTKVVCHLEKPIGSQMLKRRCFTEEELDLERERLNRMHIEQ